MQTLLFWPLQPVSRLHSRYFLAKPVCVQKRSRDVVARLRYAQFLRGGFIPKKAQLDLQYDPRATIGGDLYWIWRSLLAWSERVSRASIREGLAFSKASDASNEGLDRAHWVPRLPVIAPL